MEILMVRIMCILYSEINDIIMYQTTRYKHWSSAQLAVSTW